MQGIKNELNNKKILGIIIVFLVVIVVISKFIITNFLTASNSSEITPALLRAMSYTQYEDDDGHKNVYVANSETGEETSTVLENVEFSAFFLEDVNTDGYAESIAGTCNEIGSYSTLYMELNVLSEGSLKDAKITINGENFYLYTTLPADNEIKSSVISTNAETIEFNQISSGTQKLITGQVRSGDYSSTTKTLAALENNINNYSKVNSVTLTGTYVAEDGTETEIIKTSEFYVDWYGEATASVPTYIFENENLNQEQDISTAVDEEAETFTVETKVGIQETEYKALLEGAYIYGTIPELNGYAATSVEITGTNVTYEWDSTTQEFTAQRLAVTDDDGNITSQAYYSTYDSNRYNYFDFTITYPIEAYETVEEDTITYKLTINGYYKAYNNNNAEFENPYTSNVVSKTFVITIKNPEGEVALFETTLGKYRNSTHSYVVSKDNPLSIYNGLSDLEDIEDTYVVRWDAYTGPQGGDVSGGLRMLETSDDSESQVTDQFITSDGTYVEMENVTTNIGIYFENVVDMLNEDGWIKVYDDETDKLIVTFTYDGSDGTENWNSYSSSNPYYYSESIDHIRIETSDTNANATMYTYNIKELNDEYITTNYSKEYFETLLYIQSTLTGYIGDLYINTDENQAHYEASYSIALLGISSTGISTQVTENTDITIKTSANYYNQAKWVNGTFLIEMPKDIINLEINSVSVNNNDVEITSYEKYEENGITYIKINTENEDEATYTITINVDITPNPRMVTTVEKMKLYAYNENTVAYETETTDVYDINGNLSVEDTVGIDTLNINLVSPSSLLTLETITNYDDEESETIAPNVANVAKEQGTADINISIINNYSGTISGMVILGRIPYEGNAYVINGSDLGSDFTTTMVSKIEIPDGLTGTVYYSANGTATKDLNDSNNGWITEDEVTDLSKIKSYLIDISENVLEKEDEYTFTYTVDIPSGLDYNDVAYSHHAVYFNLDTEDGKYATYTEPNKVGMMIAKQFDLELIKYQINTDYLVAGATYKITDLTTNESKTATTNENGLLTLSGLYVDREYEIQEIKSPSNYELNSDVIKFTTTEEDGKLVISSYNGTVISIKAVQATDDEDCKVEIKVEDEVKATIKIVKTGENYTLLEKVKFKLTGKNYTSGKVMTTDSNGEITLSGLSIGETYTIEEIRTETGYYLAQKSVTLKIVSNNDGTYQAEIISNEENIATLSKTTYSNGIPTINLNIQNEKIPTYSLDILKIKENDEEQTGLSGARFELYSEDTGNYTYLTTDENGKVTFSGLYDYVEEKYITGKYKLTEIISPDGYVISGETIEFYVTLEDDGSLKTTVLNESDLNSLVEYDETSSNGTISIVLQNSPKFTLKKVASEDNSVALAGAKFILYEVDATNSVKDYAKDTIGNYIGELNEDGDYIITTDENGEYSVNLPGGFYKLVEVEAPEGYELADDEYFTIEGYTVDLEINTVDEFLAFASSEDTYDGKLVVLTADLDFDGVTYTPKKEFDGYFLGQGHTISNLSISNISIEDITVSEKNSRTYVYVYEYTGLFATTYGAKISGIKLENVNINFDKDISVSYPTANSIIYYIMAGGLIGYAEDTEVSNCYNQGGNIKITIADDIGYCYAGGIMGCAYNSGTVSNCYNTGTISVETENEVSATSDWLCNAYVGGIIGNASCENIENCFNTGTLFAQSNSYSGNAMVGGITGLSTGVTISKCYNVGNLSGYSNWSIKPSSSAFSGYVPYGAVQIGGITGAGAADIILNCYNEGSIEITSKKVATSSISSLGGIAGGIVGSAVKVYESTSTGGSGYNYTLIINCYNEGSISSTALSTYKLALGGVAGYGDGTEIYNCYSVGSITETSSIADYIGGIIGYIKSSSIGTCTNTYWLDSVADLGVAYGTDTATSMSSKEIQSVDFVTTLNENTELIDNYELLGWSKTNLYPEFDTQITITEELQIETKTEITIEDSLNKYVITTEIGKNLEEERAGGTVTGYYTIGYLESDYIQYVESILEGYDAQNNIIVTPDDGYEISSITLDGEKLSYTPDENGVVTLEALENVTADHHYIVIFDKIDYNIKINKIDSKTGVGIENVTFDLDQIEVDEEDIGELTSNGAQYLSTLNSANTYYFTLNEDNTLIPNNKGIDNKTANSYITIDLSSCTGTYYVVVNASISSEEDYDIGYATILSSNSSTPSYNSNTGRFMYISGTVSATDYTSAELTGGNIYYLYLGYRKSSSTNVGDDTVIINSINVINSNSDVEISYDDLILSGEKTSYYFEKNQDGTLTSNNQNMDGTVANSYIEIDLSEYVGDYNLIVNAEISSQTWYDYGYATITSDTTAPDYSLSTGRFIYISGTVSAKDYTTVLEGGSVYYLHLGYRKNETTSSGTDTFTINSIKIEPTYNTTLTTDENGLIEAHIPYGIYTITEISAPEEYCILENPITIKFDSTGNSVIENKNDLEVTVNEDGEFIIQNQQAARIEVYHIYVDKNGEITEKSVADSESSIGSDGEKYTTTPYLKIDNYTLATYGDLSENTISTLKSEGYILNTSTASDNDYYIPSNSYGIYEEGTTSIITYYYVDSTIPLTVYHYIEGTETPVPTSSEDIKTVLTDSGYEGEKYETYELTETELAENYELVETPENATGYYESDEVIVKYYYKIIERDLSLVKTNEDGETLESVKFKITGIDEYTNGYEEEYTTNSSGKINITLSYGTYEIVETETISGYKLNEAVYTIKVTKNGIILEGDGLLDVNSSGVYVLEIINETKKGKLIVHHWIIGTQDEVPASDGGTVEDETKTGEIGEKYATKVSDEINEAYEYVSNTDNTSGEFEDGTIVVIYYYNLKQVYIEITGEKTWITPEDKMNLTATIELYRDDEEDPCTTTQITGDGTYKFENLEKYDLTDRHEYVYTVKEVEVTGYTTKQVGNDFTNTIKQEYIEITGNKTWITPENKENLKATIELYRDGGEDPYATVEITGDGEYKFENLEKYDLEDGHIYTYTVKEATISGYTTKQIENDFINTIEQKYTEVTVNKTWQTEEDVDKLTVTINLYRDDELDPYETTTITGDNSCTFKELPVYDLTDGHIYTYTVDEEKVDGYEGTVDITGLSFTNTRVGITSIEVEKVWIDNKNVYETRPESVTIELYANEEPTGKTVILSDSNDWKDVFENLDAYDEKGKAISYTVKEETVSGYTEETSKTMTGYKIVNTIEQEYTEISGTKTWKTIETVSELEATIELYQDGDLYKTEKVTGDSEYTFTELPVYDLTDGHKYEYTIDEAEIENYQTTIEGYDITNTYLGSDAKIENEIIKEADKQLITEEDEVITYNISYEVSIDNYKGKATITIVDYLPYEIYENLSSLNDGIYDAEAKTITWIEEVEIKEFGYTNTIEKEISVSYKDQDVTKEIENTVKGTTVTYYPETHPTNPNEPRITVEDEDEKKVEQEYTVEQKVTKVWDDNENKFENRPDSVEITLYSDGDAAYDISGEEIKPVILNAENNWEYTFENLPKYDSNGNVITYTIKESDENLEYYSEGIITYGEGTIEIKNVYKYGKVESEIEKTATEKITSSSDEITYTIDYKATISEYLGEVELSIVDYLPYKIAEDKSDLNGGTYDAEAKTITWKVNLGYIDTDETGDVEVEFSKTIKIVYGEYIELPIEEIVNEVKGTIYLIESETTETVEYEAETETDIRGTVIVKYIDIDTGEEVADRESDEGAAGAEYTTEQKEIEYYVFVEATDNTEGNFEEGEIEVTYYYRKAKFNFAIDKVISSVTQNGKTTTKNSDLVKAEVGRKEVSTSSISVTYKIIVTNTEEIKGTATIVDYIPDYFTVSSSNPSYWKTTTDGNLSTEVELEVGERKELTVILDWIQGESNFGTLENVVKVVDPENPANYQETTTEDNEDSASIIISVRTGWTVAKEIAPAILLVAICLAGILAKARKNTKKEENK